MSTRSNIIIRKGKEKKILYHHCDGYPKGVGKELYLYLFFNISMEGKNFGQIVLFDRNYDHLEATKKLMEDLNENPWSSNYVCDDYISGDIEFCYLVDLDKKSLSCYKCKHIDMEIKDILKKENKVFRFKYEY